MHEEKILEIYRARFGGPLPLVVRSPGRVNLIGEHTDYNDGFVLPAAVDRAVYLGVASRPDDEIHLYSADFQQDHVAVLTALVPNERPWTNYILGVVDQLLKRGCRLGGFNLVFGGDVPIGAGLSSSAAVECAAIFALNRLFDLRIEKMDLVKMAQKAEHTYAGVLCGIMDQFASMFGKKDCALKLDCRSLDYEYVPLPMSGHKILLLNTHVEHSLAATAYNTRRQECEQGVRWVQAFEPAVQSLRDVTLEQLERHVAGRDALIFQRCRYVVEENQRLLAGCEALQRGDLATLGRQMFLSHDGLSRQYEVSCRELDFLVDFVRDRSGVLGARMMGGGFGGCTINLVRENDLEPLVEAAARAYRQETGLELSAYVVQIENGTG